MQSWVLVSALLAACGACGPNPADPPRSPPTASVTTAASVPTLLEATVVNAEPAAGPDSGDSIEKNPLAGCELCHVDIEDEFLPSKHFAYEVGCADCHGPSEGHLADENNEVKPDVMFTRKNTDSLCVECHGCSRPDKNKKPALPADPKICTECHGPHDLALLVKSDR